jgi:hypothetical protein
MRKLCASAAPDTVAAMFDVPAAPEFPPGTSATTSQYFRYEDVTMDGRLIPIAAPAGLAGLWREVLVNHAGHKSSIRAGVIPILTRLTMHTTDQQVRVDRPFETTNGFALAHDRDADGAVNRIFMNIWCQIRGVAGRLGRESTGELSLAGSVFAEHTYTRPLAPPDKRRVTALGVEGLPDVPEARYAAPAPVSAGNPPSGAQWLDELMPDATDYVFTLDQTDSNQHVNSLVYIRLVLEAVNRRLADRGEPLRMRANAVDIAYRKPCFAGDRVRAHVRLFRAGEQLGAAGHVTGSADGKPRCYVRVALGT